MVAPSLCRGCSGRWILASLPELRDEIQWLGLALTEAVFYGLVAGLLADVL